MLLIPSLYILEKISLSTNIRNKCVTRKRNLYFSDVIKNGQIFPSKVCHFQYDNRLLFSRKMGNIRSWKEVQLQKLIKFRLSDSIRIWHFSGCLKLKNPLGRVSPHHFLQNVLTETLTVCFKNF